MKIHELFEKLRSCLNFAPEKNHDYMLEIRRLHMLENAITHYSGGIDDLISRVASELKERVGMTNFTDKDENLDLLLRDLYFYLRDISSHLIK